MVEIANTTLSADANLQLYYKFESNLTDSSSGGHNGTDEGGIGFATGKYGSALSTTNAGNKRVLTNWTPAFGTGQFSIVCWVYPTAVGAQQGICSTVDSTALQGIQLKLGGGTDAPQLICNASSGNADTINAGTTFTTNKWYHVAAVRDASNLRIYTNGIADGTPVASTPRNVSGGVAMRVACTYSTSGPGELGEWDGYIDDFAVFDRALTAAEVLQIYMDGSPHIIYF